MSKLLRNLNYARTWRGYLRVWGADIYHPSLDRWLYLLLHRCGRMGRLERRVIEAFVHPGMAILDLGGNIGLYTALFSRCVGPEGKVTTLEPVTELYEALLSTIKRNHFLNVETYAYAAGSSEGFVNLELDSLNSGNNWVTKNSQTPSDPAIPVRRVDSLKLDRFPDFIKIDVQGWEVEVLRGMTALLNADRQPTIYYEISHSALKAAGSSPRELCQILLDCNYEHKLPILRNGKLDLVPLTIASLEQRAASTLYFDVLALPRKESNDHTSSSIN